MQSFKQAVQRAAKDALVDMIGFAGRSRFDDLLPDKNPFTLFSEAKTAILIARRITRGTLRGVEEGINFGDYSLFGKNWLSDEFIAQSAYDVATFIERAGYEAMPIVPEKQVAVSGVGQSVFPDFKYAAVACGLGEIGLCGEVLTPRFGPRQRLAMILTDAEIPEDPIFEGSICTQCGRCIEICPLHAFHDHQAEQITICGKTMQVAVCDNELCGICKNGAITNHDGVDRLAALCVRTCIDELDQEKVLMNTFETNFRKRPAWGKNEFGEAVEVVEGGQK